MKMMKCERPLWGGDGMPAGVCDGLAYGPQIRESGPLWLSAACPLHGGPRIQYDVDGNKICATVEGFRNLQEDPAGFGDTQAEALRHLHEQLSQPKESTE